MIVINCGLTIEVTCAFMHQKQIEINRNMIQQCWIEKQRYLPHCYSDKGVKKQIVNQKWNFFTCETFTIPLRKKNQKITFYEEHKKKEILDLM